MILISGSRDAASLLPDHVSPAEIVNPKNENCFSICFFNKFPSD